MKKAPGWAVRLGGIAMLALSVARGEDGLRLPSVFSEGMVLQRDLPVPVWGEARPGARVTVRLYDHGRLLADASATARADDGAWRVDLPPQPAGGRFSLLVESRPAGADGRVARRLFTNVLIGEVWILCGQSNALFAMNGCAEREDALARLRDYPLIRVFQLGGREDVLEARAPRTDTQGYWGPAKWEEAAYTVPRSSETDVPGSSSAVSYFFARALARWLGPGVPVGMIEIGAILPVESWVDDRTLEGVPALRGLRGKDYPHATGRAFNALIAPLAPYAVRGAAYYQGEMNAGRPADYYHGLKALVAGWRRAWDRPDLPFLLVQLPGFIEHLAGKTDLDMNAEQLARFDGRNADHPFCRIREAQRRVSREVPGVGLAVTIDTGERFDIHPPRKRAAGERLALQARKVAYGDGTAAADGPRPRAFRREGGAYLVAFDGVGGGLRARGRLDGFELRDADGAWHPAPARIRGDTVEVRAEAAAAPTGVRYAWAGYPPTPLYNAEGLPATPFHEPPVAFDVP